MSSIPNSAMPHAVAEPAAEERNGSFLLDGAQRLADKAREAPVASLAIGVGVVAATAATVAVARRSIGGDSKPRARTRKTKS